MKKLFIFILFTTLGFLFTSNLKAQACFDSTFTSSAGNSVNNIYVNNDKVYVAGSTGFSFAYLGSNVIFLSGTTCYDICEADSIYIATINGLKTFANGTISNSTNILPNNIKCLGVDKYNNIWAGGDNGLIVKTSTSGWQNLTSQINGSVKDIFTDSTYTYVCTNTSFYIFNNTTLSENFTKTDINQNISNFNCIAADNKGNIWIGTDNYGIFKKANTGEIFNYRVQDGYLNSNEIHDIKLDKYNNIWVSTNIGLTYYDGKKWFTFNSGDMNTTSASVNNTFIADNGYIWVALYNETTIPILTGGSLNVNVNDNSSHVSKNQVLVELYYRHPLPGTGYNKFAEAKTDINGIAHFTGLLNYNYYVKTTILDTALLNNGLVNTYYGGALSYDSANTVTISCDTQNISINLLTLPPNTNGYGEVAGTVKYHSYSKAAGEPVPGAEIIIEQEPTDDPIAINSVDNEGSYHIPSLQTGYYKVILEYPGIPNITTYDSVHITNTNPYIPNLNFLVDTTVNTGGAYADTITLAPIKLFNKTYIKIYPNPTNDVINIDINNVDNKNINFGLYNLQGQKITEYKITNKKNKIYLKNLKITKGIYLIKVYNKNNTFIKKIIYN